MPSHIRKGDSVVITAGDHKGKLGRVKEVRPKDHTVIVEGLNLRTKHIRPSRTNPQGGIITREGPIHISNVSPAIDGKPSRVRFSTKPDGSKVRLAARGGSELGTIHGPRKK